MLTACTGIGKYDFVASPAESHGMVVSNVVPGLRKLHTVTLDRVNQQLLPKRRSSLWLKPSKYQLNAIDFFSETEPDTRLVNGRSNGVFSSTHEFDLDVEAGKVYYIALKAEPNTLASDWEIVVWKVEDQNR